MANIGYIQLNRICNQSCLLCSNPDTGATLNFNDFKIIVDDFKKRKYLGIILTGGEPTIIDYLPKAIKYCNRIGLKSRIITNGQITANYDYLKDLVENGLELMHVSLYSYKPKIQSFLSQNPNSFANIKRTLNHAKELNLHININTVINKYNADHLDKTVYFLLKNYPYINHFVFNNLDPYMNRASENKHTIPKLRDFENSLNKTLNLLYKNHRTFRVERVPLCYMGDYPQFSTETRKIVKYEERIIHFLDSKGMVRQTRKWFKYKYAHKCKKCSLIKICAGLYALGDYFDESELRPVTNINSIDIISKIKYEQN